MLLEWKIIRLRTDPLNHSLIFSKTWYNESQENRRIKLIFLNYRGIMSNFSWGGQRCLSKERQALAWGGEGDQKYGHYAYLMKAVEPQMMNILK